ncbi:hypothetical protein J6590_095851 [Homalodisca vitripennis]|nr:hypothetical protein J6590_095851 [Homalodisca vitripennis]
MDIKGSALIVPDDRTPLPKPLATLLDEWTSSKERTSFVAQKGLSKGHFNITAKSDSAALGTSLESLESIPCRPLPYPAKPYHSRQDRILKVVVRGMPSTLTPVEVMSEFRDDGYGILEAKLLKARKGQPTSLWLTTMRGGNGLRPFTNINDLEDGSSATGSRDTCMDPASATGVCAASWATLPAYVRRKCPQPPSAATVAILLVTLICEMNFDTIRMKAYCKLSIFSHCLI